MDTVNPTVFLLMLAVHFSDDPCLWQGEESRNPDGRKGGMWTDKVKGSHFAQGRIRRIPMVIAVSFCIIPDVSSIGLLSWTNMGA